MKHNWEYKRLGDVCVVKSGYTPSSDKLHESGEYPYFKVAEMNLPGNEKYLRNTSAFLKEDAKIFPANAIVFPKNGAAVATNKKRILFQDSVVDLNTAVMVVDISMCASYVYNFIQNIDFAKLVKRGTIPTLNIQSLKDTTIPVPPMEVQEQIVAELDKINELIETKREQLKQLDSLAQSIFYETFGDPVTNPKSWNVSTLEHVSSILRDGPFGSNLKSDHYRDSGTRVIRLQNIGVGYFSDNDKAYIDEDYYWKISKYTCYPRDIVIGTMGNPNLRACIVPNFIDKAIHKADCIRCVPKDGIANSVFISSMLNTRSILNIASKDIHGATRARISSGQLKQLKIIVPPLSMQEQFAAKVEAIEAQKTTVEQSIAELQTLLDSRMDYWFN